MRTPILPLFAAALLVPLLGTGPARAEQVLFTEIHYHPRDGQLEYLEVSNNTVTPLDMARWTLRGGVDFDFPDFSAANPSAAYLGPYERIILSPVDAASFRAAYGIAPSVRVFGPWSGSLDNAGERITLRDATGVTLCTVRYNNRGNWPPAADGAGHSLVLVNPNLTNDDWRNWAASTRPGGSPGSEPIASAETAIPSPEIDLTSGIPFIDYGDEWRFNDSGTDLGTAWRAWSYTDTGAGWSSGPGLLGFESSSLPPPGIQTPMADNDLLTRYLRKSFTYNGDPAGATINIDQIIDDGAVYYLNGQEIGRPGMDGGTITFLSESGRTVTDATEELNVISVSGSSLSNGVNVLAVELHQTNPTSSDAVFGARLKISAPSQPSLVINEVLPAGAGVGFVEFYNPTPDSIDLRDHYLSNDGANLQKYRISTSLLVPPGGLVSVGFTESLLTPSDPVVVYLTAPDGETAVNALSVSMPLDGRSVGRKPTGSSSWYLFTEPTRDAANLSQENLAGLLQYSEIHFSPSNTVDWVEFYNRGVAAVSLDRLYLASTPDASDRQALAGTVPGRGYGSRDVDLDVNDGEITLYLVDASGSVMASRIFDRPSTAPTLQAFPAGADEFYATVAPTRDTANQPDRNTDVVIHEIMYDPPSNEVSAEFVELYNRGTSAVDLSGWRFADGIDFSFPDGTTIPAEGYLVVAADAAWMQVTYGDIPLVGNYGGQLGNQGDSLRLVDADGNLADAVDYRPGSPAGGAWPGLANGDGSSMELLNPWMDNSRASAWASSDESSKGTIRAYSVAGRYERLRADGGETDYEELHLHLVGDAHVAVSSVRLLLNGGGANLLNNTTQMSTDGRSANGWLAQGTHYASHLQGSELHLIADGHGDNRANRVEIDATAMVANQNYTVRFNARWVAGAPRLIVQTWDHSIAGSVSISVPDDLGTPGGPNSIAAAEPAAQVDDLLHSPAVPSAGDTVLVTARVFSPVPSPAPTVRLFHRADNNNGNGAWTSKLMADNGTGGDEIAGDGLYSVLLTEHRVNGRIVQFYAEATADSGEKTLFPRQGAERPAMYVVDTPENLGSLRRMRFVVSAYDLRTLSDQDNPTGDRGYSFPRLSNHYYNMTLIVDESEIIYGCEIRNSGSPWTRGGNLDRGKFKMPRDRLFRGHEKLSWDNDPTSGRRHHNRIARYWLYLFGHPVNENEYIQVMVNNGGASLREEVEPHGNHLYDRIFDNGSRGELYRIDDEWWFTDTWSRSSRNADWSYKDSDNPGRYRTEWMKRSVEDDDDFSALISMFKKVNESYTRAEIERLIDPVDVMKMSAIRGYLGDWDSFSLNRGKNGYLYRRSTDGRFMFGHWDSDLAFRNTGETFFNGMPGFREWGRQSYNWRWFKHFLSDLVANYAQNSPRMEAWFTAEEASSPEYTIDANFYRSWFAGREGAANGLLGSNNNIAFSITTNGGNPMTTSATELSLVGVAPLGVFAVRVQDHPEVAFTWVNEILWSMSGIRLTTGTSVLTFEAVDQRGAVLATDTISVTKSGNAPPVVDLEGSPASWHVALAEEFRVDAGNSYDPDGTPLQFNWEVLPAHDVNTTWNGAEVFRLRFPAPGLYEITADVEDGDGGVTSASREAAVFGPGGFSSFSAPRLESYWNTEKVALRNNYLPGSYYSVTELDGHLVLQVLDAAPLRLGTSNPAYPFVWRDLPAFTPWAFATKLDLRNRQFGDFSTGIMIQTLEGGANYRYFFGIENGTYLAVKRITAQGTVSQLAVVGIDDGRAEIRVRRISNIMRFEHLVDGEWANVHVTSLPLEDSALRAGMMVATDQAQRVKVAFDYALLIDPAAVSPLADNLRISEVMYAPVGGSDYEFLELVNIGNTPLDITGVRIDNAIEYTFLEDTVLLPHQYLVVAGDLDAFVSRYGTDGLRLAPRPYAGKLSDGGETIDLYTPDGGLFLSFMYDNEGDWPSSANEGGSSLEIRDPAGDPNDPANWRASAALNGSPGTPGQAAFSTLVVVNEALTHSDLPFEDAIELMNRTAVPVDVSGWYLSDDNDLYQKFQIPDGTVVPPFGTVVLYEQDFNTLNPVDPFSLSSARGDQVYLTAADGGGELTGYQSLVEFGAAANGTPFGRYETSVAAHFPALTARTLGQDAPESVAEFRTGTGLPNAAPLVSPVVISEIMYHPPSLDGATDNTDDEFVEILNRFGQSIALYDPAITTNTWHLRGGVDYDFPVGTTLLPHEHVLVVGFDPVAQPAQLTAFRNDYGVPAQVRVFGPYDGKLDNRGEAVRLNRPDSPQTAGPDIGLVPRIVMDEVNYRDVFPWASSPDGLGDSLQRRRPGEYGDDPVNWRGEAPTPGRVNVPGVGTVDADADGLPDDWETDNGLSPADPTDPGDDDDLDGRTNRGEFYDRTDPQIREDRLFAPSIVAHPADQGADAGGGAVFTVEASGTEPLWIQWRFNDVAIPGETNQTLSLVFLQDHDAGRYGAVVWNDAGFVHSDQAVLQINQPLIIQAQPVSRVVQAGDPVSFSVLAAGTGVLSYQWKRDGIDLPEATGPVYSIASVSSAHAGNYAVAVTDDQGTLLSAEANLTVLGLPNITTQPEDRTFFESADVFFEVEVAGDGPFTFQWRKDGIDLTQGTCGCDPTGSTLALLNAPASAAGVYSVLVVNPLGSVESHDAVLTLVTPATITLQPVDQAVRGSTDPLTYGQTGTNVTFEVDASSSTPIRYQWRKDGFELAGATNRILTLTDVTFDDDGAYQAWITDDAGSIPSDEARLTVLLNPEILIAPISQTVVEGGDVTFSVVVRGNPLPMTYEWRHGTNLLQSDVDPFYVGFFTRHAVEPGMAGTYSVRVGNAAASPDQAGATFQLTVEADGDGDGMPDSWEDANGLIAGDPDDADIDRDLDGHTNLEEYLAGTDPRDPGSYLAVDHISGQAAARIEFEAAADKTYTVLVTDDITTGIWYKLVDVPAENGVRIAVVEDPDPSPFKVYHLQTPQQP